MSRSRSAEICEKITKTVILPKGKTIEEVLLLYRKQKGKKKYNLPLLLKMQKKIDDVVSKDMQLFYMNVESESDNIIIYLHGGAYVSEILPFHWLMLDKITSKVKSTFIIPDYPLAPYSDYKQCYKQLLDFYKRCLEYYPDKKIIMMGDSAGGGLSLAFSMYLAEKEIRVPDKLILLSPWLDLNMDNPDIVKYMEVDPTLKKDELLMDAKYWANGTDLADYRLSPINGDVSCLKDVTMFVGTHEIFYPDIIKFKNILDKNNIKNKLYIGEELNHVYPAYPIPEADEAIEIITDIINEKNV